MSILIRLKQLKQLAFLNTVEYSLERALAINALSLENIEAYKEMRRTEGWVALEHLLRRDMKDKERQNMEMSIEPIKNRDKMLINYAIRETISRLLGHVDGVTKQEKPLREEQLRLSKVATDQ